MIANKKRKEAAAEMDPDTAAKIIVRPYVTERTFEMAESHAKLCFIVDRTATKHEIAQAINTLYKKKALDVNTARTVYGKKAFVRFESVEKARDLATDIGML